MNDYIYIDSNRKIIVTRPIPYTPIFAGFTNPTNILAKWRRVGKVMQIEGSVRVNTVQKVLLSMSIPNGYIIKRNDIPASNANTSSTNCSRVGYLTSEGSYNRTTLIVAPATSLNLIYGGYESGGVGAWLTPRLALSIAVNNAYSSYKLEIPISGWD